MQSWMAQLGKFEQRNAGGGLLCDKTKWHRLLEMPQTQSPTFLEDMMGE